jgi:pyruvate dehydrogenase E2 component (dihydrolipoamide acetyltransferase)
MPILGADMTAGTLRAWHKRPGDSVKRGDIIAEVETEKGIIDVEIFTMGVIETLLVAPGATVPVGTVLALIREEGEAAAAAPPLAPRALVATPVPIPPAPVPTPAPIPTAPVMPSVSVAPRPAAIPPAPVAPPAPGRVRISPVARKRAAEVGVDPASLTGTGPDGSITLEDVERAAVRPPAREGARFTPERMRQTIGAAMARSKREIPHYYLATTIDLHRAMTWLTEENLKRPVTDRLLPGVLFLKAVARALREVPELNAVWRGGQVVRSEAVHVGVAISLRQGGLVAPALHDTDRLSLDELMRGLRDLVKRARAGSLRSSELSDPTITVTSLGDQGVETVFGIIYPPQVAIVGVGKVVERPWSVDGQVVSRPVVTATLSGDHRVTDGHRGALFLAAVDRLLQEPARL